MTKLRLFIGCEIPKELRQALLDFKHRHEKRLEKIPGIKWTDPNTWHITLLFLGNVEEAQLRWLKGVLSDIANTFSPITLNPDFVGYAPPSHRVRMIWYYFKEHPEWTALSLSLYHSLTRRLRVEKPRMPIIPHITLARFNWMDVRKLPTLDAVKFRSPVKVSEIILWSSRLYPSGPQYTPLFRVPLASKLP
ncbi:MAG: RNA 2',3'-cyclic phosphodiesterase [Chlorobi bacterium]|nr:RNA 2',3'-cyclic phosphodiesterase [Chlorobiota bacterium]